MSFKPGTVSFLKLDGANGAGTNISSYADDFGWPQPVEMLDVSVFGTGSKAFIGGLTDGAQVTVKGPLDSALAVQLQNMKGTQTAGGSTYTLLWGPLGSVSGNPSVSAETLVASIEYSSGVAGRVEYSAVLQVTGAVTNGSF